jgi:ectonucleotide pyrophosphatase/phosphodiesterase family member 5
MPRSAKGGSRMSMLAALRSRNPRAGRGLGVVGLCALVALALIAGSLVSAQAQQITQPGFRVYVIVLDGLRPQEVNATLTPNLNALRSEGTWYEQARAVFPAETLPNHAAMMTGVLPQRSGIIGNDYWLKGAGGGAPQRSRMAHPNLLGADTLTTRLENNFPISTATVQSKGYLWGLFRREPDPEGNPANLYQFENQENADHPGFQRQADYHPNPNSFPGYIIDPDDHTVDQSVMNLGFRQWVRSNPPLPQFAFVNLGDIDRSGHIDQGAAFTAGGLTALRQAALTDTDALIGQFVDELKDMDEWEQTVLIFASDHGMDWSLQDKDVSAPMTSALRAAGYRSDPGEPGPGPNGAGGDYYEVAGGGTSALYVEESEDIAPIAKIAAASTGVALVGTRSVPTDLPASLQDKVVPLAKLGMDHPKYNGDVVVLAQPGWAFRSGNPVPGNHGHPVTQNSVLMVTGGHHSLDDEPQSVGGAKVYDPPATPFSPPAGGPGNLSIAPTVAALFGLGEPLGGYDGAPLRDAFEKYALAAHTPGGAAPPPKDSTCVGRISSPTKGNVQVPPGSTCTVDADVRGSIQVEGTLVVLPGRTVGGSIRLLAAEAQVKLQQSTVSGAIYYKDNGTVELSGATVGDSVIVEQGTSELRFAGGTSSIGRNLDFRAQTDLTGTGNATVNGDARCNGNVNDQHLGMITVKGDKDGCPPLF